MDEIRRIKQPKEMPDILSMSLYDSMELEGYTVDQILEILTFKEGIISDNQVSSVDCYCNVCKRVTTFRSRDTELDWCSKMMQQKYAAEENSRYYTSFSERILQEVNNKEFFSRSYYCPRNSLDTSHDIILYFRVRDGKLMKIGQFPAKASLENPHLTKYKKLDTEIYKELNTGVGLHSHGVGVGAFVYLRRIIEKHIVYPTIEQMKSDNILNDEQLANTDFKQKINLVKDHLPKVLVDNPILYSILSKGIHSLKEDECNKIFPALLTVIELILDERLEQKKKEEKLKKLGGELSEIEKSI